MPENTHIESLHLVPSCTSTLPELTGAASRSLFDLLRLQAEVLAVLPAGDHSLVSHDLRINCFLRPEAGFNEERHLLEYRCVCVCVRVHLLLEE